MKNEIFSKISDLKGYVDLLKSYRKRKKEDIKEDPTLRGAVERYLQLSIEIVLEIGEMIISKEGLRKPETYKQVIEILGERGVLPKPFAKRFSLAAGFRNILIHRYGDIDADEVCYHLKKDLEDFETFSKHIARFIQKESTGENTKFRATKK